MKKTFHIFFLFSKYSIKSTLQNRFSTILFIIGKLVRFSIFFFFISYLLQKTQVLAGYTFHQTLIFFLTYNVIETIAQLLFREVYRFGPLVVSGELDTILIKPYHPFLRILVGGVDPLDMFTLVIYLALLIYFILSAGVQIILLIPYIALIINALIIATSFHIAVLALGVLTTEVDHTIMLYRDITRLGTFPIDIYKEPLKSILTFVIPIGIMMSFPVKSLFRILSFPLLTFSITLSCTMLLLALMMWNKALQKYQSWGG